MGHHASWKISRTELVVVEDRGASPLIRINRPDKRNAMNRAARRAMAEAACHVHHHKVVVLTGTGASFCSGHRPEGSGGSTLINLCDLAIGADTRQVLADIAGCREAEIDALLASGVAEGT